MDQNQPKTKIKTVLPIPLGVPRAVPLAPRRFINYLAPDIDKSEITQEELEIIYQRYEELGPKWSMIQQSVKCKYWRPLCRTQCKIKNVFYGNIKNLLKTVYKFFTLKTAPFINSIPTDFLQVIYDGSLGTPRSTQSSTA